MPRKGENIFRRKDGRWEARYARGREPSGKMRYGSCYGKTYQEAKDKVVRAKAALTAGRPVPAANRRRFAFYCGEWLEIQRTRVRESTYEKYETMLRRHILPRLGDVLPADMTTRTAETFKMDLLEDGLAVQTVRNILMALRAILKYAAVQWPGRFPTVQVANPKEPGRETRVLTVEEQLRLTTALKSDGSNCAFGILLTLMTGMRIGEVCALKWENISLDEGTLRVNASVQRLRDAAQSGPGKTKISFGSPKSAASVRVIPLTENAVGLCRRHDPHRPSAYVLTGTEICMEPRALQRRLEKYTKRCGLEGVHFHTLRHTFATRCVEAGFEIKSLSEILGHASTSTTLDRYVHSSIALKRSNMAKLSGLGM